MLRQQLSYPLPLEADAATVNQPDLAEAGLDGRLEIGLHRGRDLARREGMQVERVFDRHDDRLRVVFLVHGDAFSARARSRR